MLPRESLAILVAFLLGAAAPVGAFAQDVLLPERVVGCYTVTLDAWEPQLSLGQDEVFLRPPHRIQLRADTGTTFFEQGRWLVRPAPGSSPSIHRFSYFRALGSDTIEVIWTTGFSGLHMRITSRGGTLTGRATSFWDFPRPTQVAPVRLEKINCG